MERTLANLSGVLLIISIVLANGQLLKRPNKDAAIYTNTWGVELDGAADADDVATTYGFTNEGKLFDNIYLFKHSRVIKRSTTGHGHLHNQLANHPQVKWLEQQVHTEREQHSESTADLTITDPKYNSQWPLHVGGVNVVGAYQQCVSGRGVTVAVVDDGIDFENQDLKDNFLGSGSYDHTDGGWGNLRRPDRPTRGSHHGTQAAGLIAAKNNSFCGIGVAYNARLVGRRIFGGDGITDAIEALGLKHEHVDIFSNSWGPPGNGDNMGPMKPLATRAVEQGILNGRERKGAIYVFSAGNGGIKADSCAYDGFVNSIYTIGVTGITKYHQPLSSGEECSAVFVTAYSKDTGDWRRDMPIVTTDWGREGCTTDFSAASAAAPLVSGVVALALEANPDLSWRDVQHLLARTSTSSFAYRKFRQNKAQYQVSDAFGFGLVNAEAMVREAKTWAGVENAKKCSRSIASQNLGYTFDITSRDKVFSIGAGSCNIMHLEHVQVKVKATYCARGLLGLDVTSPSGFTSTLLPGRRDDLYDGDLDWTVMSVQFWGEPSRGEWKLAFKDVAAKFGFDTEDIRSQCKDTLKLTEVQLILHGTVNRPGTIKPPRTEQRCSRNVQIKRTTDNAVCRGDIFLNQQDGWRIIVPDNLKQTHTVEARNINECKALCLREPRCRSVQLNHPLTWNWYHDECHINFVDHSTKVLEKNTFWSGLQRSIYVPRDCNCELKWRKHHNYHMHNDNAILRTEDDIRNVDSCKSKCMREAQCSSVMYGIWGQKRYKCFLLAGTSKSYELIRGEAPSGTGYNVYERTCDHGTGMEEPDPEEPPTSPPARPTRGWGTQYNACLRGYNDLEIYDVDTLAQCQQMCTQKRTFRCLSIDYLQELKYCVLSQDSRQTKHNAYRRPCPTDSRWTYSERTL